MSLMRFELLGGSHTQWHPEFVCLSNDELNRRLSAQIESEMGAASVASALAEYPTRADKLRKLGAEQTFRPGQVVESTIALDEKFGRNKFRRLGNNDTPGEVESLRAKVVELERALKGREVNCDSLDTMTISQIRKFASENDIDLPVAGSKAELVSIVRAAAVTV